MLFDGDNFLLRYEAVPAAKTLGVPLAVLLVLRHVRPHDLRRVLRHVQSRPKLVLQLPAAGKY